MTEPSIDRETFDWDRLDALRRRFLGADEAPRALPDYWLEPADLEVYDRVLAARIGWKWDAVLAEVEALDPFGRPGLAVDWGCGTGVAARRFAARFPGWRLAPADRSPAAVGFARARLRAAGVALEPFDPAGTPDLLLVSHVLGELDAAGERALVDLAARSRHVLWVEAGTRAISRRLSAVRDALRDRFDVVAPCPHQGACGALSDDRHWCHFFARPPAAVFQDAGWREAGVRLGIDLRALPYHFVLLRSRDPGAVAPPDRPDQRLLGRPDVRGKLARVFVCDAAGVRRREVFKGSDKALYQQLRKQPEATRFLAP